MLQCFVIPCTMKEDMDVISYTRQKEFLAAEHRRKKDLNTASSGEFLTGMAKGDRLAPVVTLVLYLNDKPWDGARSLHEMLNFKNISEKAKKYIENYNIHILDVCHTPDRELQKFPPDIRFMLMFIKYTKDKKALADIRQLCGQETIAEDTFDALADYMNEPELWKMKEKAGTEKGRINMCEGLRELMADSKAEGREETLLNSIKNLMETLKLTAEQAMDALKIPDDDRKKYVSMLK